MNKNLQVLNESEIILDLRLFDLTRKKIFFVPNASDFGNSYAVFAKKSSFSFITLILIICKANIKTDKTADNALLKKQTRHYSFIVFLESLFKFIQTK